MGWPYVTQCLVSLEGLTCKTHTTQLRSCQFMQAKQVAHFGSMSLWASLVVPMEHPTLLIFNLSFQVILLYQNFFFVIKSNFFFIYFKHLKYLFFFKIFYIYEVCNCKICRGFKFLFSKIGKISYLNLFLIKITINLKVGIK